LAWAAAAVVAAFLLRQALGQRLSIELPVFFLFYPAVMLVALFCGLWPGMLATILAAALADFWIIPPIGQFGIRHASDAVVLVLFIAVGALLSGLAERFRRDQRRAASFKPEQELRESKEMLQQFIEHAPAALAMFDREMRYLSASQRWLESYSLSGREIIGVSHYEIFPDVPERWKDAHRRGLAGEATRADEDRFDRADGTQQWIRWEILPWRTTTGAVGGIIITSEDITERKQAEEGLRLAASVFTHAAEGIVITAPDGAILDVNDAFTRITGYTRQESVGRNPRFINSGRQDEAFYAEMWRSLIEKGQWSGEIWNRGKDGEVYAAMETISAVLDADGQVQQYVALSYDITRIKENEQQLKRIAHYDLLTGLPNRVLFADRLNQAMAQSHRRKQMLAVVYLDLDGFKVVNDRHGHDAGDELLTVLAARMKKALREGDTLARLGGDEFVAVLLDLPDAEACEPVLARLLEAAGETAQVGDYGLRVSASVGVAFYPQADEMTADQLLRQADQAMYEAKQAGRNRYQFFDANQDRSVRGHHENLERIRRALAAGEFVLHYQPKVNMRTGEVVGAEALIRWQHPERGLLPPATFLPIIEDHPLAVDLGEWVIDAALAQMESWQATGHDIPVSVNVGALQLQQENFADRLRALLAAHPRVSPGRLEMEVVETSALNDLAKVSQVLNLCRDTGVSFALDDFGTGYSSLTYLKRLPARLLKIDQSFVREMLDNLESLSILEGVLGLASAFRREVIAEGVETVEHGLMLLQLGCDLAQGFGIAHPMPAPDLPAWKGAWRPDPQWVGVAAVSEGDRPRLYAAVEHQAWVAALDAFFLGVRQTPPQLESSQCRFAAWMAQEKQAGRGTLPTFQAIERSHRQVHALAADLLALRSQGRDADLLPQLGQLHGQRDLFLEQLKALGQQD
jgi:diguanylate cyclase (GGDEF)-like protein/PAS domain S-box-containing protein